MHVKLDVSKDLDQIVRELESRNIDISPNYDEYLTVAFSLANEFGESGRNYFHRVGSLSSKYDYNDAEVTY